jgi:predicted P-loop ATPase
MMKRKDLNDALREDGPDAVRARLDNAEPAEDYLRKLGISPEVKDKAEPKEDTAPPEMPDDLKAFLEQIPPPEGETAFDGSSKPSNTTSKKKQPNKAREGWANDLIVTKATDTPKAVVANALIALRKAPEWQGVLAYDEFALVTKQMKPPPWLKHHDNSWEPTQWTDRDDVLTADWLQHQGISITTSIAAEAVETVAKDAAFHPIKDYLRDLAWDGRKRIETFASNYLGAEAKPYHNAVSRCLFIAGVARIMRPGCKADYVPIFEGVQDKGKSTAIELLFSPWFSDDLAELGSKDAAMQARVAGGIEIPELASMNRADIDKVKAFITRKVDRFRPSYGRRVIEAPRQSIFVGSTNADTYLKDETGGRRFWPIRCIGEIDLKAIERDRDHFWAEAVALYKEGTPWWFTDNKTINAAREEQADRYVEDPWQSLIAKFIEIHDDVSIDDVLLHVGLERSRWTRSDQMRVAGCLKVMGWERYRARDGQRRDWRYRLGPKTKVPT